MYTSIKGIYENGVLTFSEPAPNIEKSEVLVTFLNEEKQKSLQKRVTGGLKHLGGSFPDNFNDSLDKIFDL